MPTIPLLALNRVANERSMSIKGWSAPAAQRIAAARREFPPITTEARMTLLANLIAAEQAAKFANDKLRGRSSNRSEDIVHTLQHNLRQQFGNAAWADDAIAEEMSNANNLRQKTGLIHQQRWSDIEDARTNRNAQGLRLNAAAIMADNIGNCFEHGVLACHYLNQRGIASYLVDTDDNTNHSFVLIGAPAGLDGQMVNVTTAAPGAIAGAFTVVCDPWYHEWGLACSTIGAGRCGTSSGSRRNSRQCQTRCR